MIFRAVKTDGKSFEKKISVETGEGNDDVLLDSSEFGFVHVNGGNDNVIVTGGSPSTVATATTPSPEAPSPTSSGGDDGVDVKFDGGGGFDILTGGGRRG